MVIDEYELQAIIDGELSLTNEQRYLIIKDALQFEECDETKEELENMSDEWLCRSYRRIIHDYCLSQI